MTAFFRAPIILALFLTPFFLNAATLEELQELVLKEKFEEAFLMAQAMSGDRIGEADFDFLYGLISRYAGRPEIAVFALERVLMQNPDDARALYEHAQALTDLGDLQAATVEFENVLAIPDITQDLKDNTEQVLEVIRNAITESEREGIISATASFDVGYNSNVNSGTRGPPIFPIQGEEVADGFANLGATSLAKKILSKTSSLYFTLATDNRKNFRSIIWDSNWISSEFGGEFNFEKFVLRIPFGADFSITGYAAERFSATLGPELNYGWNNENFTSFSVGAAPKVFVTDSTNNYMTFPISLSHWTASMSPRVGFSTGLSYTPAIPFSKAPSSVVHSEASVFGSASIQLADEHYISPSAYLMYLYYPLNTTLEETRHDLNFNIQITYEWRLSEHWALTSSFAYNYGWSTDPGQSYMRYQPQAGVRYQL